MPKKFIKREQETNNGAFGTTNFTQSSENYENERFDARPEEMRNWIKINSITMGSVKSKQDVVMKRVKKCDELKKSQSEYIENQAYLSNQLRLINHTLAQKESLVESLTTENKKLKLNLFLLARKGSEDEYMRMEVRAVKKSFNNECESLKRELQLKSEQDTENQHLLMEELKQYKRKDAQIFAYITLIITLIIASIIIGVKEVLFLIALYFLVQYFIQKFRKYISSLLQHNSSSTIVLAVCCSGAIFYFFCII